MSNIAMYLQGGLGNQLFQYAFAEYLSNKGIFVTDYYEEYFKDVYDRKLVLNNILVKPIEYKSKSQFSGVIIGSESETEIIHFINANNLHEKQFLLNGFFQKIEFLSENLREKIKYKFAENQEILALHVRRANYAHHGVLPISYYNKILQFLKYPKFIIYTDEVNFCEFVFSRIKGYQGVIKPNLENPSEDFLRLMSHKNIIMSNSSFSYLAAYLSFIRYEGNIFYPTTWSYLTEFPGCNPKWVACPTKLVDYYN